MWRTACPRLGSRAENSGVPHQGPSRTAYVTEWSGRLKLGEKAPRKLQLLDQEAKSGGPGNPV